MGRPKTLFAMFGHECDMKTSLGPNTALQKTILNNTRRQKKEKKTLFYHFKRWRMINETNKAGYNFLRSYRRIQNEYKKHLQYPLVIHPFSNFRRFWETVMMILLFLQFIMPPLDIATFYYYTVFKMEKISFYLPVRAAMLLISVADIGVEFMSGYLDYKNTVVVLKPLKIFKHYIFPQFIIDLVCSFPVDLVLHVYEVQVNKNYNTVVIFSFHFLGFMKLIRYPTFVKYARNISEGKCSYYTYKIIMAFVTFCVYIHVICCFCIAWNSLENPVTEADFYGIRFKRSYGSSRPDFLLFYVKFLYGSCFLVLTSGYAFTHNSNTAIHVTVVIWLLSRISYIMAIAYFFRMHISVHSSQQKYIDMVSEVKDYMQHRQIPSYLRNRIIAYFDIKFQNKYFRESDILMTVSGQLKQEIVMHKTKQMVQKVPFFQNIPLSLLVRIVSSLEYEIFLTNDVIIKYGSVSGSMYFICNGTVGIYSKSGREMAHLQDHEYFGEAAILIDNYVRNDSVIAAEVCEVYRLDRKRFLKAIMPYPDLYDKIKNMANDNILVPPVPEEIQGYKERKA